MFPELTELHLIGCLIIISLDAGLRLDGIPALVFWDLIVSVLGNTTQNHVGTGRPVVNKSEACFPPHTIHIRKQFQRVINDMDNVDFIPSNVQSSWCPLRSMG